MELIENKMYRVKMIIAQSDDTAEPQTFIGKFNGQGISKLSGREALTFSRRVDDVLNVWICHPSELVWAKEVEMNWRTERWVNVAS